MKNTILRLLIPAVFLIILAGCGRKSAAQNPPARQQKILGYLFSRGDWGNALSMAQDDFTYFTSKRAIPANRLLIGLPFYGYGFGGKAPESLPYKEIIARYPGAENKDEINLPEGGHIYYNGIPTIRQKCAFAKSKNAAGVMIWELQHDSQDENSLLKTIAKALN